MSQSRQKSQTAVKRRSKPTTESPAKIESAPPEAMPGPAGPPRMMNHSDAPLAEDPSRDRDATDRSESKPVAEDGLSDQPWLEALPLYAQLRGIPRCIFAEDALTYRRLWAARRAVVEAFHQAQAAFRQSRSQAAREGADATRSSARRGEFRCRTWSWINLQNPENWSLCPPAERGGCGGTGQVGSARCRLCQGNGYLVGHIPRGPKASDGSTR